MKHTLKNRLLAFALTVCAVLGLCVPAHAASIGDGSKTCTVALGARSNILETTTGTILRAGDYTYTTNDGLSGPAYCIDHGLEYTDRVLPITGKYTASPATAGAFANGYPQHSLETFLDLYLTQNAVLEGLTEAEYAYATQVAVWATLGQLGVDGTPYTAGREYLNPPTGDTQQARVFRAAQLILEIASTWNTVYQTGMYIRLDEEKLDGNITIDGNMTLEFAAARNQYGIKCEVINGVPYYTREYIFASATSTYYSDYSIELWADNAPAGTIFTSVDNVELARSNFRETATWRLPTEAHYDVGSQINNNGYEYWGRAKLCIPAETAPNSGEITVNCGAYVMQYEIYLANNEEYSEQSYIIADPSKGTQTANALLSWGSDLTEVGHLQVTKVGGGGAPLSGAEFSLTGTDGTSRTATTDENGKILWTNLGPHTLYTLTETKAPAGYAIQEARNVTVTAAQVTYETVKDDPLRTLTVRKLDKQNGYSLRGATFAFEQIDGNYKTTAVTDHAGNIQFNPDTLPLGAYKVYEIQAPEGYELDKTAQTVNWDGKRDVTLTFQDTRKLTLILSKKDSRTGYNLPEASFAVYRDGQLVTTVTTNDNGLAYVPGVMEGYYEIKEVTAPEGYVLNSKTYGINIDPYDTTTTDDPRLVIENDPMPSLRIVKHDRDTGKPLDGVTFKVYKDATLFGTYTTDKAGEILLTGLEPGTYAVEEINAGAYVADATPQQIELTADRTEQATLVFFNAVKPGIHIRKVDADTLKPLEGAAFLISRVDDSYRKELQTNANGEIDLTGLEPGIYSAQETVAPAGYLPDSTIRTFQVKAGQNAELVFSDSKKPSLTLTKQNTEGDPLAGTAFSLTPMGEEAHSDERTTDAKGQITWEGLEPGLYSLVEVAAKDGYVRDTTEHHVRLYAGRDGSVTLTNQEKPSLKITKYDRTTHAGLPGVTFEVFRDTVSLGKFQTDSKGDILLSHVDPGTYKAVEMDTGDDGHILDTTPQEVELRAGDGVRELVFFNDRLPGLHLIKVDAADLSTPIPNAKFSFKSVKGDYGPVEHTTDRDGTIDLSKLPVGAYEVVELACPGYVVDDAQRLIHLGANQTGQFVFTNTKLPGFALTKTDADGKPLEGVTFRIAYIQDGTHYMDRTTDANGKIVLDGLTPGVLSVVETATLPNYILDTTEHHVELTAGKTATLDLKNDRRPNLTIHKADADTDEPVPGTVFQVKVQNGHSVAEATTGQDGSVTIPNMLPGVYEISEKSVPAPYLKDAPAQLVTLYANKDRDVLFQNHAKPGLTVNKIDSITGDPISGVKFKVIYASNNTSTGEINDLGDYTTDQNGQIYLENLKDGWYKVTELAPKAGYAIKDSATQECYIKSGTSKVLSFQNTPLSALVVYKYDSVTGAAVQGAVFQVKYLGGTSGSGGTVIGTYKTSANGSFTVTALEAGTYIVEELASDSGHVIDTAPQTALISGKEQDVVQLYFGNSPKASLTVKKIDSVTHAPLSDVEFMVTLADGSVVGDANGKYVTDSAGSFTISGLNPGASLVVKETRAKDGYILDDAPQTITVKAGQVASLEFRNAPTPEGGLRIVKLDEATRQPISGVEFSVTCMDGKRVGTYRTNSKGIISLTDLTPGWYTVTETKAAEGYALDAEPKDVEVVDGETSTLQVTNRQQSGIVIRKVDGTTGEGLYGAVFVLYDSRENPIGEYQSDQRGYVHITGLVDGKYLLREIKAPEGYLLDNERKTVYVRYGGSSEIRWENTAVRGQIQIVKKSADYNSINGLPAGTFLEGAVFEVYNERNGALVDTIISDSRGVAVSKPLPLGRYTIREVKAPANYTLNSADMTAVLEYSGQIVRFEVANKSISVGAAINKTGPKEAVNGQPVRYVFSGISNTGNVTLDSFYWRDTLPSTVTLDKVVTGTYNHPGTYKVIYKVNNTGDYRTLADNLSTGKSYTLTATPAALGLAANERITEVMFVFGQAPDGFSQVEAPMVYCTAVQGLAAGSSFANVADVGGVYNGAWVQAVTRWTTTVYGKPTPLPRTGY